jgi:hypothetical protein
MPLLLNLREVQAEPQELSGELPALTCVVTRVTLSH